MLEDSLGMEFQNFTNVDDESTDQIEVQSTSIGTYEPYRKTGFPSSRRDES